MVPELVISGQQPCDRFERLQTWMGVDRESEWFVIPPSGVGMRLDGVELRANPSAVHAVAGSSEIRVRALLHAAAPEARVRIEAILAEGGLVVLRDAFGTERLQLLPGSPRLQADLEPGRYSIDAVLPISSTLSLQLVEPRRAAELRGRVG